MKKDVVTYIAQCLTCLKVKTKHQRPSGMLQLLPIPVWTSCQDVQGHKRARFDMVIVDKLSKSTHFIPIQMTCPMKKLAKHYVR